MSFLPDRALDHLRDIASRCDTKHTQFRIFESFDLAGDARPSYAELAAAHGIPVTTVTNHLAWAPRELRRLVRERLDCA